MTFLAEKLKSTLPFQLSSPVPEQVPLLFWASFMAVLSIFQGLEPDWLREGLRQTMPSLGIQTWPEARDVLKTYPWTDMLHDEEGEKLFNDCLRVQAHDLGFLQFPK